MDDDGPDEDDYRGGEGFALVAVGMSGTGVLLDFVGPEPGNAFGAMNYRTEAASSDKLEDLGVDDPPDTGLWIGRLKAWTARSYEGEHDMGFNLVGEWQAVDVPDLADWRAKAPEP